LRSSQQQNQRKNKRKRGKGGCPGWNVDGTRNPRVNTPPNKMMDSGTQKPRCYAAFRKRGGYTHTRRKMILLTGKRKRGSKKGNLTCALIHKPRKKDHDHFSPWI